MKIIEGELQAKGLKFGIVISRFNEFITSKLLDGAKDALVRHGAKEDDIDVVKVPGSFEIPMIAKKMAVKGVYNAIICLGTVIRGLPRILNIFLQRSQRVLLRRPWRPGCP